MSEDTLVINDESASEADTLIISVINEDSVVLGDVVAEISEEREVARSKTSLLSGFKSPFSVGEGGVGGTTDDFAVVLLELLTGIGEIADFGRADESEVQRVEEEDHVLSFVVGKLDLLEAVLVPDGAVEFGCGVSNVGLGGVA